MKLSHLKITNILALRHVDLALTAPILFVGAANEGGKTSLAECLRAALLGDLPRIELKKESGQIIREGAKSGSVELQTAEAAYSVAVTASGFKRIGSEVQTFARACLLPGTFGAFSADERRGFLFSLLGRKVTAHEITARLAERGCDEELSRVILPVVSKIGFPDGVKEAERCATEARGAWKAVAGEAYGSDKAGRWKAEKPLAPTGAQMDAAMRDAAKIGPEVDGLNQQIGALNAAVVTQQGNAAKIEALRVKAANYARAAEAVNAARKQLTEHEPKVTTARAEVEAYRIAMAQHTAGVRPATVSHPCSDCGVVLEIVDGKTLRLPDFEWHAPEAPERPLAVSLLPQLEKGLTMLQNALADREHQLKEANDAAAELKGLETAQGPEVDPTDLPVLREKLVEVQDRKRTATSEVTRLQDAQKAAAAADEKTAGAAKHHAGVLAWLKIAEALSPAGIPGEILSETLKPFNDRLAHTAALATWKQPMVRADMEITCDGRLLQLESESARWRADLLLAEAISHLSGFRMLLLDRFDVNLPEARVRCIALLNALVRAGEIDTAVLLGSLKAPASGLGNTIQAVWLEGGAVAGPERVAELIEAARIKEAARHLPKAERVAA